MSGFGRLIGKDRPIVPAGGRAFACNDRVADATAAWQEPEWTIRYTVGDEDQTSSRPRVPHTPEFTDQVVAYAYLAWVLGEADTFEYPPGRA